MHGFLNIDKPAGPTSHDIVARLRRLSKQRRVGHAGTLDPAATGVLVVALGTATRLIEYVQDQTLKRYTAHVRLGITTATDDAAGEITGEFSLPELDTTTIEQALTPFRGDILQTPPMYAALHHEGRRLYELARAGIAVDLPPRPVTIERLDLVEYTAPLLTLDILCGKGTYIRALARDLGAALGCGAHLAALRRTAVGAFQIANATPLAELEQHDAAFLTGRLLPPETAVADWHVLHLDREQARRIRDGLPIAAEADCPAQARGHGPDGALLALLRRDEQLWRPLKVFDWTKQ